MEKFNTFYYIFVLALAFNKEFAKCESEIIRWVPEGSVRLSSLPPAAYVPPAGHIPNGKFYIGRAHHLDGIIPGKVWSSTSGVHFVYKGKEIRETQGVELLVYPRRALKWVEVPKGDPLPPNPFQGGIEPGTKEPLYICRVWYLPAHQITGKLNPSDVPPVCRVPCDWKENIRDEFDILVYNNGTQKDAGIDLAARLNDPSLESALTGTGEATSSSPTGWIVVVLTILVALLLLAITSILIYFRRQWSCRTVLTVSAAKAGSNYQLDIE